MSVAQQEAAGLVTFDTAPAATAQSESVRKYAVELIGTFFLVLTVGASVYGGSPSHPWPSVHRS